MLLTGARTCDCIADAYHGLGAPEDALGAAERGVQLDPEAPVLQVTLACQFAVMGRRDAAQEILHKLETESQHKYVSPFYLAWYR